MGQLEPRFSRWANPPGQSERDRIENSVRGIRAALNGDDFLSTNTKIYVQGSYRNRVNVRADSDVDIGVLYSGNTFFADYPAGMDDSDVGNEKGGLKFRTYKDRIGQALVAKFGAEAVSRGNKAFDIDANSYRVDADVVPVFVHRRYGENGGYICGVQLLSDRGEKIVNWPERLYDDLSWPEQHYENGVKKNQATGRRYKGVVRIVKSLRNQMDQEGIVAAKPIPGFLIECLVWNVPNVEFEANSWESDVDNVLAFLWANTRNYDHCKEWGEVSDLKYIFKGSPIAKWQEAHAFIDSAWDYVAAA